MEMKMEPCINLTQHAIETYVAERMFAEINAIVSHKHSGVLEPEIARWLHFHYGWYELQTMWLREEWKLDPSLLDVFVKYLSEIKYHISDNEDFEPLVNAKIQLAQMTELAELFGVEGTAGAADAS